MGLFNFFKKKPLTHDEKVDMAYRCYKPEMVRTVFPGGKQQAGTVIISIARIVGKEISSLDAKEYYELLKIYADVLIRSVITQSADDSIITSLQAKHEQIITSKAIAQKVLAYCTINMKNNTFCLDSEESMSALKLFDDVLSQNEHTMNWNVEEQNIHVDDPDYGLVPEKPVYVKGVNGSKQYLNNLLSLIGGGASWNRIGSIAVDKINGMVDVYEIIMPAGENCKTIYLNMYGTENSKKYPKGLVQLVGEDHSKAQKKQSVSSRIIADIPENLVKILIMNFLCYKNNGKTITNQMLSKGIDSYDKMTEFEDCIKALANSCSSDAQKSFLQLAEEAVCPPSQLSEGAYIFSFANKLRCGIATPQDAQNFEEHIKETLLNSERKDYSLLEPNENPVEYSCPQGAVSTTDLMEYNQKLACTLVFASHHAEVSNWFRKYQELSIIALHCAQQLFDNGNGVIQASKVPGINGNIRIAFHNLCAQSFYSGIIAAKTYCEADGRIDGIEQKILQMNFFEVVNTAALILGYSSGEDNEFRQKYMPITIAAAEFLQKTKTNQDLFLKCMLLTLNTVFEFGAGLYYEE